jgi:hypothetical protein
MSEKIIRKRIKKINEEIYNICFTENHSKYKINECPFCKKYEKLIIEKRKLIVRLFYGE